jgi:monoamine oxidase
MGSLGKAIAVYDTPFWHADGLNGQAFSDSGVLRTASDSSPKGDSYGKIMGFIMAN